MNLLTYIKSTGISIKLGAPSLEDYNFSIGNALIGIALTRKPVDLRQQELERIYGDIWQQEMDSVFEAIAIEKLSVSNLEANAEEAVKALSNSIAAQPKRNKPTL